ncbi:hypothetical protein CDD81_613 [Ophiocordyceps australis]|uniref:FAD/NAD(P)-binding domain-containing protein n=1 Tax=Ophiocordyceps australis TaxID=1399860 RepID=A0A2C5XL14_9HYPO|nr:hypothetical protein CDD81_613 [Ophiocordyceps australis]
MYDLFAQDLSKLHLGLADKMRISTHDAAHEILAPFEAALKQHAMSSFSKRSVQIVTEPRITQVKSDSIVTKAEGTIPCGMVLWTAGNKQCALVDTLDVAKTDRLPHVMTDEHLHVLSVDTTPMSDVFALGDSASVKKLLFAYYCSSGGAKDQISRHGYQLGKPFAAV